MSMPYSFSSAAVRLDVGNVVEIGNFWMNVARSFTTPVPPRKIVVNLVVKS